MLFSLSILIELSQLVWPKLYLEDSNFCIYSVFYFTLYSYSQDYQADYKTIFGDIQANPYLTVYLKYSLSPSNGEVPALDKGEIKVNSLLFLKTGIAFKGVTHMNSTPDLISDSGNLFFIPYTSIINAGANGLSDFVLLLKTN